MKLGKYKALEQVNLRNVFLSYVDALEIPIIDYVAIGVQDTIYNNSTSLMSREDWQTTFKKLNLANYDPVRKAAFNIKSNLFAFDELDYQDEFGKEVMRQRKLHQIENGFVIMRKNLGYNFMLTLATGFKNFRPYRYFLENETAINKVFDDLIELVSPSTLEYQINFSKCYQGVYAK